MIECQNNIMEYRNQVLLELGLFLETKGRPMKILKTEYHHLL